MPRPNATAPARMVSNAFATALSPRAAALARSPNAAVVRAFCWAVASALARIASAASFCPC